MIIVYISMGGNLNNPLKVQQEAIQKLKDFFGKVECSHFYKTSPVSVIPQEDYVNSVCRFETDLSLAEVSKITHDIEKSLGKVPSGLKDAPRTIDLDILFYGNKSLSENGIEIPHPRWQNRLFVLVPLLDLTDTIIVDDRSFNIQNMIKSATTTGDRVCRL